MTVVVASVLSKAVRRGWARAAVEQADRLAADAVVLLDLGSASSAYGLATLALEEAGKALICLDPEVFLGAGISEADVLARLRRHEVKLDAALSPFMLMGGALSLASRLSGQGTVDLSALNDWSRRQHRSRLKAMYVDYARGGAVRSPADFPADEARFAVDMATVMAHVFVPNLIDAVLPVEPPAAP